MGIFDNYQPICKIYAYRHKRAYDIPAGYIVETDNIGASPDGSLWHFTSRYFYSYYGINTRLSEYNFWQVYRIPTAEDGWVSTQQDKEHG